MSNITAHIHKRRGSKILLKVTLIVLGVFIISATLSLLFFIRSTQQLSTKSKDKVIKTEAENLSSGFEFVTKMMGEKMIEQFKSSPDTPTEYIDAITNKKQTASMQETNKVLEELVDDGLLGVERFFVILDAVPPAIPEPVIIESSDAELAFADVPDSIRQILKGNKHYGYMKQGIPEWGLEGDQLFVFHEVEMDIIKGIKLYASGIKPLAEDFTEINDFYNEETKKINALMAIIVISSLIVLVITTYFILSYLIRKDITKPIEELSDAAEKVMDGDLDVEVSIRKGEEFANLKKAFNEMIKSIRSVIARSSE